MKYHQQLAQWANGDNAFTALAIAAGLDVKERNDVGVSGKALRDELARGKSKVELTLKCAALTNDEALLRKLARERRVAVRAAAMANPRTPLEVLDETAVREKNWDVRRAATDAMKRRIPRLAVDDAVAMLEHARSEEMVAEVLERVKLTDEHMRELVGKEITIKNRWGSERQLRAAEYLILRNDLAKFSDDTLVALAHTSAGARTIRFCAMKRRDGVLTRMLGALEADSAQFSRPLDMLRELARARGMEPTFYERVLNANERARDGVVGVIAENEDAPWQLLAGERVNQYSAAAVGRAMRSTFSDDPAVWLLAATLMENTTTVGEVLEVLSVTHPEHIVRS